MPSKVFRCTKECTSYGRVAESSEACRATKNRRAFFCPAASRRGTGDLFRNPDMARALRLVAEQGPEAFYKGEIAAAILKTSKKLGGTMTAQDLASFSSEWVEPISIDYRGWRVYELPPNGQGMAALEMLNIMETSPPSPRRRIQRGGDAQAHRGDEAGVLRSCTATMPIRTLTMCRWPSCSRRSMRANEPR